MQVLSGAGLYVGGDSGVSHLAAAVGVRAVVLFGPSDERVWRPLGPHVTVVAARFACRPCHLRQPSGNAAAGRCHVTGTARAACLDSISVSRVVSVINSAAA